MAYNSNLPDDCQGYDPSYPWNQNEEIDEPLQSKGSDCCDADVKHVDGFMVCQNCGCCCEDFFENFDEQRERLTQQREDFRESEAEEMCERRDHSDFYPNL